MFRGLGQMFVWIRGNWGQGSAVHVVPHTNQNYKPRQASKLHFLPRSATPAHSLAHFPLNFTHIIHLDPYTSRAHPITFHPHQPPSPASAPFRSRSRPFHGFSIFYFFVYSGKGVVTIHYKSKSPIKNTGWLRGKPFKKPFAR